MTAHQVDEAQAEIERKSHGEDPAQSGEER